MLVDFIVERSEVHPQGIGDKRWILEIDGSSRTQGGGANMVLRTPKVLLSHKRSNSPSQSLIMRPSMKQSLSG